MAKSKLFHRAQYAVLRDFDQGFFAAIRECDTSKWPPCDAREVAEHVQSTDIDAPVFQAWHTFPGGYLRFCNMLDTAREEAEKERGKSAVSWHSVAMADEVLRWTR